MSADEMNNQAAGATPKATIRLKPNTPEPADTVNGDDEATIAISRSSVGMIPNIDDKPAAAPAPAASAPKATIRLQPKDSVSVEDTVPTVSMPKPAAAPSAAPKATIRLQPKDSVSTEETVPSMPKPAAAATPKATIRLQPKDSASTEDTVPTVSVNKQTLTPSSPTVKNPTPAGGKNLSKQTIKLSPKGGQAGMIPDLPKPSSPTVKLSGAKPSAPTVKLSTPSAQPAAPAPGVTPVQFQEKEVASSKFELITCVASLLVLAGSAALIFMSYNDLISR